jgi:hypothetical protein
MVICRLSYIYIYIYIYGRVSPSCCATNSAATNRFGLPRGYRYFALRGVSVLLPHLVENPYQMGSPGGIGTLLRGGYRYFADRGYRYFAVCRATLRETLNGTRPYIYIYIYIYGSLRKVPYPILGCIRPCDHLVTGTALRLVTSSSLRLVTGPCDQNPEFRHSATTLQNIVRACMVIWHLPGAFFVMEYFRLAFIST